MLCYNATQGIVTSNQNEKLAEEIFRILSMVRGFLVLHRHGDRFHRACDYFPLTQPRHLQPFIPSLKTDVVGGQNSELSSRYFVK